MRTLFAYRLLLFSFMGILLSPWALPAQDIIPYISPGFRLGYVFGEGFTYSLEMTAGLVFPDPALPGDLSRPYNVSFGGGVQVMPTAPKRFTYVSLQGGLVFGGITVGRILYEYEGNQYSGTRLGVWGGALVLGSWEYYTFPDLETAKQSIGIWVKYPIFNASLIGFPF